MINYTTTVDVNKTLSEIQALLIKQGASAIYTRLKDGRVAAISFTVDSPAGPLAFTLPADVGRVHAALRKQRVPPRFQTPEHAERVAWRVIKDWLAAQLSLIEAQMADVTQVMLPYLHVDGGEETVYDRYLAQRKAITT